MSTATLESREASTTAPKPLAWQGWTLSVRADWNPLKLEGDFDGGSAVIGDLRGPQVALRWGTPREKTFNPDAWSRRAIADQTGSADESRSGQLPGWSGVREWSNPGNFKRNVWVGYSSVSGRVLEIIGSRIEAPQDSEPDAAHDWSIFDLSCRTPRGWRLHEQRLNAGDLMLAFSRGRERMSVRQIALAQLALKRRPLEGWLNTQVVRQRQHYRAIGEAEPISIGSRNGATIRLVRRRRFCWSRNLSPNLTVLALYDERHDRLMLVSAPDASVADELCRSVRQTFTGLPASAGGGVAPLKPLRSPHATFAPNTSGGGLLRVPLKARWPFRFAAGAAKAFELDELGRLVWEHCDGEHTSAQIVAALAERYRLNLREAEVATMSFLRTLTSRGLVTLDPPERA
jgi:hypothetical protein